MPPMSSMWAAMATQATSSSPTNTGCWTTMSCGCNPPPLWGSLATNTSPAAMVGPWRLIVARTACIAAPKCDGATPVACRRSPAPEKIEIE